MTMGEHVLRFECFPSRALTVLLFKDVANSKELREAIVAGTLQPEAGFLNAAMVPSPLVLHAAAHRALDAERRGGLTTRTLHTELVFNTAGSKHIGQSLTHFGIGADTGSVLVARFDATPAEAAALRALVRGTPVPMASLPELADEAAIRYFHKVPPQELQLGTLAEAAVLRVAARD